jgi:hypothetical protein
LSLPSFSLPRPSLPSFSLSSLPRPPQPRTLAWAGVGVLAVSLIGTTVVAVGNRGSGGAPRVAETAAPAVVDDFDVGAPPVAIVSTEFPARDPITVLGPTAQSAPPAMPPLVVHLLTPAPVVQLASPALAAPAPPPAQPAPAPSEEPPPSQQPSPPPSSEQPPPPEEPPDDGGPLPGILPPIGPTTF